jgi:hypothetical protein
MAENPGHYSSSSPSELSEQLQETSGRAIGRDPSPTDSNFTEGIPGLLDYPSDACSEDDMDDESIPSDEDEEISPESMKDIKEKSLILRSRSFYFWECKMLNRVRSP